MATATLRDLSSAERPAPLADERSLLRFIACGSVDDGKSTLIGRLLHDAGALFADQVDTLAGDSRRFGTRGNELDFALLVDGLAAEREQGITIDVAYRYFARAGRRFIVADAPGHEQYTRNMVTAASTADLAVLLIDAGRGLTEQTRRHARIVRLLGVRSIVVAINKMDVVGYDRARFDAIVTDITAFARAEAIGDFIAVPVVAVAGGNIARRSTAMPWYAGPTLLDLLERAPARQPATGGGFAMPVQWVSRPDSGFRGYAGTIARGIVKRGDAVAVLPGGQVARVARIATFDGDLPDAAADRAVTIALDREVECAAGATLVAAGDQPGSGDILTADFVWFDDQPLAIGRRYLLQVASARVPARIEAVLGRLDGVDASAPLAMNGIAEVRVRAESPIIALPYVDSQALGGFVLIDPVSNATAAAGMMRSVGNAQVATARAAAPIHAVDEDGPAAQEAVARLQALGRSAVLIDRAALRAGIAADLRDGADAAFWQRAIATAALIADAGVTVVLAIATPPGAAPVGQPWPGDDADTGDWVI